MIVAFMTLMPFGNVSKIYQVSGLAEVHWPPMCARIGGAGTHHR
jgi:hypothetical protein